MSLRIALGLTPSNTLLFFACLLGLIGDTEAPNDAELIRRIEAAL